MLLEGTTTWFYFREITRNLQLHLRKEGINLSTTAEFEVVRTIKEKACYVSLNPSREEIELAIDYVYTLPDGKPIKVL